MSSMRSFIILLPVLAVLAGCSGPPSDLGPPPDDCAARAPAGVSLVAGPREAEDGVLIASGNQGGNHLWVTVKAENLGPIVLVEPAVRDAETGALLSQADLQNVVELEADDEQGFAPVTVQGRLADDLDLQKLVGKAVTLSAKVSDACPHAASAERTVVVEGFEP